MTALHAGGVGSAPAAAPQPGTSRVLQGQPAGVVSRTLASAVDLVVVVAGLVGGYLALCGVLFLLRPAAFSFPSIGRTAFFVAGGLLAVAYLWLAWALGGRTIGDELVGLRVVGRRGNKLGVVRAALRAAFCVVFPIGLLWSAP